MNKMKRLLAVIIAIATLLSMCAILGGCKKNGEGDADAAGEAGSYSVTVKTAGGMAMEGISVYVYSDEKLSDMLSYGTTDENGSVTLSLEAGDHYISLGTVPKGYAVENYYTFSGNSAEIKLTSSLVEGESLAGATLGLGDVMYDFEVTAADGTAVKLSQMLAEKDMVLLNFWFSTCGPCANEFPYMEEAYQMYKDNVGIIAVDPLEESAVVAGYQSSMGLTFPMAACPSSWSASFGITGYPTSIIIDRYGVICLIEVGGVTSLSPFTSLFETFTGDDYEQKLYNSIGELVTTVKPTYTMDTSENIAALINSGDIEVTYRPETEDESAEYAWPFIAAEKNGEKCLKASNQEIDGSFAIIYADVTLKAGQALGFDFLRSTEAGADIMYVIVNGEDINAISGAPDPEKWEACYPVVAAEDGVYEVALCYIKDESTNVGDDTVYIKNMRVVNVEDIDAPTYLPRKVATSADGFEYDYAELVYNSEDGYYHVGSKNGPLLLADLMNYTEFNEETTIWEMTYAGDIVVDGKDYTEVLTQYANYSSNSNLNGICTVNQELYDALIAVDQVAGFDDEDDMEWLKACKYYQAYGTDGEQLEDPIKGLATFSAYTATLGKNVPTNYFYYNRIIMPRGMLAEFVPSKSGVYRFSSSTDYTDGVEAWIFDENGEIIYTYAHGERMFEDLEEVSVVYYMEKGKSYYINMAFWDPYQVGYIYYDVEYVASSVDLFRLCSPGYFTYDTDATGEALYDVISGGIDVVLGSDGYYYEDLGGGKKGSKIYADFTGITGVFDTPIATVGNIKGMIDKGGFDFSKSEYDQYVLTALETNGGDKDKTLAYLKEQWGTDYEAYYEEYKVEDVFAGIYHGPGKDYTAQISKYLDKINTSGSEEIRGCVAVDKELAEILQQLMDKFTFEGVENSWIKLCYYYDYLGPEG